MKSIRHLILILIVVAVSGFLVSFSAPVASASSSTVHIVNCPDSFFAGPVVVQSAGDDVCYEGTGKISVDFHTVATICMGTHTGVAYYYDSDGNYKQFNLSRQYVCYGHAVKQFPLYHVVSFQFN